MEKTKTKTVGQYRVRKGSPVDVRWAVRSVEEDLWRKGLLEKVCVEFRVEASDGSN